MPGHFPVKDVVSNAIEKYCDEQTYLARSLCTLFAVTAVATRLSAPPLAAPSAAAAGLAYLYGQQEYKKCVRESYKKLRR